MKKNTSIFKTLAQNNTTSILMITALLVSTATCAQQTCKDFVDNHWQNTRYEIQTINDEIIVTDFETGLMWQQCTYGYSGADCATGNNSTFNWQQALEIPHSQNSSGGYAGYNDWRLPNITELRTLIALNCYSPAINITIFPNTKNKWFWTSSPFTYLDIYSWKVNFTSGKENVYGFRTEHNSIRLVRNIN